MTACTKAKGLCHLGDGRSEGDDGSYTMKLPSVTDYQGSAFHYLPFITRYLWQLEVLESHNTHASYLLQRFSVCARACMCVREKERQMVQKECELCREMAAAICYIIVYFTVVWICWRDCWRLFWTGAGPGCTVQLLLKLVWDLKLMWLTDGVLIQLYSTFTIQIYFALLHHDFCLIQLWLGFSCFTFSIKYNVTGMNW